MTTEREELRKLLYQRLSIEELRSLTFDLNEDFDGLEGNNKSDKLISLISHLERRQGLNRVFGWLERNRPDIQIPQSNALYIISDRPGIQLFDRIGPRTLYRSRPGGEREGDPVRAVDRDHLHNYLLPLDCPRVTFYALPDSSAGDVERLMGLSTAKYVVAIESRWLPKFQNLHLYRYEVPGDTFVLTDAGAGHYSSDVEVRPRVETRIDDLFSALLAHDVELRVMPSLWKLYDAVLVSTLHYSMIRMRNAFGR